MRCNSKELMQIDICNYIVFSGLSINSFAVQMSLSVDVCRRKIINGTWSDEEKYKMIKLGAIENGKNRRQNKSLYRRIG